MFPFFINEIYLIFATSQARKDPKTPSLRGVIER